MSDKGNIQALLKAASERRLETEKAVIQAIEQLQANNDKITFTAVASLVGVTKAALYRNVMVKKQVEDARNKYKEQISDSRTKKQVTKNEKLLNEKLRQKDAEIKKLREQLEIVYGKLYEKELS